MLQTLAPSDPRWHFQSQFRSPEPTAPSCGAHPKAAHAWLPTSGVRYRPAWWTSSRKPPGPDLNRTATPGRPSSTAKRAAASMGAVAAARRSGQGLKAAAGADRSVGRGFEAASRSLGSGLQGDRRSVARGVNAIWKRQQQARERQRGPERDFGPSR